MINFKTYLEIAVMAIPFSSAFAYGLFILFSMMENMNDTERQLKRIAISYYFTFMVATAGLFCYGYKPELYTRFNPFFFTAFMLSFVCFYRIIFFLTHQHTQKAFPKWHYILPALFFVVLLVWELFIPFDVRAVILESRGKMIPDDYRAYALFARLRPSLVALYEIVYYVFFIKTLMDYYDQARHTTSLVRRPSHWVTLMTLLSTALLVASMTLVYTPREQILTSAWTLVSVLMDVVQLFILTYHIITRNYQVYVIYPEEKVVMPTDSMRHSYQGTLSRKDLDTYFKKKKPYLQCNYKITDLVEEIDVNRTVLSLFINRTYGMNFSRFLNNWRLQELNRIEKLPINIGIKTENLIKKAGFGSLRHYQRAKAEAKASLLK